MTTKPRVLLLEDQMMIAFDLKATMERNGLEVVGPFANANQALSSTDMSDIDVAVLDFNLGDDATSEVVAEALLAHQKPFMFLTGYGSVGALPKKFDKVDRLLKPIRDSDLVETVKRLAASAG
ncbi:response regulator [Yoonia sp. SS1-5]|uniref:Response regulator n=1 Tax=Yoonia rhodophyticola TaxID=3137370 RepID=A0AAN0NK73_9RHOB